MFDIDANGIIHVSAKDLGTGNEQAITIKGDKKLSEDDIKRMVNDAKSFEDDDKKKREEIEVRNMADTAIFAAEKMLKDSGDKIEPGDREKIESGVAEVRKALESDNSEEIKKQMEALTEAVYSVTTKIYQKVQAEQQAQAASAGAESGASVKQDDNVMDADYKVKDE